MKKRILSLLLCAVMLLSVVPLASMTYASKQTLNENSPVILADVGDTVRLSNYTYGGVSLDRYSLKAVNGGTIRNQTFEASKKGAFAFDATYSGKTFRLLIAVKNKSDQEYVVFEQNGFKSADDIKGWRPLQGGSSLAKVSGGKLKLSASSGQILFPEYLNGLGNVKIEVRASMANPANDSRWFSLMYRVQNAEKSNPFPYYQMAIRNNAKAANGVEFACRETSAHWEVSHRASYTEKLAPGKFYDFKVEAYDNVVSESINDMQLIYVTNANFCKKGAMGLQVNQCDMIVEKVRVTIQTKAPSGPKPKPAFASVRPFDSNLLTSPSVVSNVLTAKDYQNILSYSPAVAIYTVNAQGLIVDYQGKKIATLSDMFSRYSKKVIPAFRPTDRQALEALAKFCKAGRYEDVAVVSTAPSLVKYAHELYPFFRGIIQFTKVDNSEKGMGQVRKIVNSNYARTAILPYSAVTKENVQYLQKLLITVWADRPVGDTDRTVTKQILSAANGIVVQDRQKADGCFKKYFVRNTMIRRPFIIGHRGLPVTAPENSIIGTELAYQCGADIVENDIYITRDGVVVIMHDPTINRTTNGAGKIEDMTYAQLQKYNLRTVGIYEGCKIPTLEEYLKTVKKLDDRKQIFIEIKSANPKAVEKSIQLIREYEVTDRVSFISFNTNQLDLARKLAPEISIGALCSGAITSADPLESVRRAATVSQLNDTTFNHSSEGYTKWIVEQIGHRGVTCWPWTYRDKASLANHYVMGLNGLTTDNAAWMENLPKNLVVRNLPKELKKGESLALEVSAVNHSGKLVPLGDKAEVVIVWGAKADRNKITSTDGEICGYCRYKTNLNGKELVVCSDLFVINEQKAAPETPEENNSNPDVVIPQVSDSGADKPDAGEPDEGNSDASTPDSDSESQNGTSEEAQNGGTQDEEESSGSLPADGPADGEQEKKDMTGLYLGIGIGAAVLVFGGAIIAIVMVQKKKAKEQSSEADEESSEE